MSRSRPLPEVVAKPARRVPVYTPHPIRAAQLDWRVFHLDSGGSMRIWRTVGLLAAVLFLALSGCARSAGPAAHEAVAPAAKGLDARALALADALVADHFDTSPLVVALLRPPGARFDTLPDDSLAGVAARHARRDAWQAELARIDRDALTRDDARLAHDLAREYLESLAALRVCRFERWSVSQMGGWQVGFAEAALIQPVDTPERREQALARYAALPGYAEAWIAALRAGLDQGLVAPRVVVDLVVGQLDALLAAAPEASPFASPALRAEDPEFRGRFLTVVEHSVRPALQRSRDFLARELAPRARREVGLSALPQGDACYRAALRHATTLELEPRAVHARGLAALAEIEAEMQAIARRSFGGESLASVQERLRGDPAFLYRDAAHVLALAEAALERAEQALPRAFGILPRARAVLEPIPDFQARTAAPHYLLAALDGSRPATYRVRLYEPTRQSVALGEATAFHEVVPGHHLQIAIANEREGLPAIARFLFSSGFAEGWALYAEQLADELGLYTGDVDRLGMLSTRAWRAARMVVDPGLHALGWDRQRALDFLLAHTALSAGQAGAEIDRYIAMPGQAAAYLVGYEEILTLRREAEARLGARFDLRAFHDAVVGRGGVSLPLLRAQVEAAIAERLEARAPSA
jgi:uncharacterized protein (DUF885 family)